MNTQELKELSNRIAKIETKLGIVSKPELEVGKWYLYSGHSRINIPLMLITSIGHTNFTFKGFDFKGFWTDSDFYPINEINTNGYKEATPQEVEEALIKEAKRRGYKKGDICLFGSSKDKRSIIEDNIKYTEWQGTMVLSMGINVIFRQDTGEWAEIIEQPVDKFAELKEVHKNGAVIEVKSYLDGKWYDTDPLWFKDQEYRIKPEEKPKVGDVCKFWNYDGNNFEISTLVRVYSEKENYKYASAAISWINAKRITKSEAIKLLFGKENEFNQTDLQTIAGDIDSIKEKYPQYNITITVEDKV